MVRTKYWKWKEISLDDFAVAFPPFLRFEEVQLNYDTGSQSISEKCSLFDDCLKTIKPALLKDSNEIRFNADISANTNHFNSQSSLLIYLRDILLPICNSSRRYIFEIQFDKEPTTDFFSSMLQIPQVRSCSNVSIVI